MMKLPKAFKKKWLKALRSGKYKQWQEWLKDNGKYCCLGIACEVAGHGRTLTNHEDKIIRVERYKNVPAILKGEAFGGSPLGVLMQMNDGVGDHQDNPKSFKEIADYIENNL